MKTSARNQFAGPVTALKEGVVDVEVSIRLDPQLVLTAIVTRESAESLGLAPGKEVLAFVKASSIVLVVEDEGKAVRISARNRFRGTVARIHAGPVNSEVTAGSARRAPRPDRRHHRRQRPAAGAGGRPAGRRRVQGAQRVPRRHRLIFFLNLQELLP